MKLSGSYLGPIYPEAPKLKAPREVLEKIGQRKYRRPGHGWIDGERVRRDVSNAMAKLPSAEQANVKAIIKILRANGSFPIDNDIDDILK
jgi:hypothetical protein